MISPPSVSSDFTQYEPILCEYLVRNSAQCSVSNPDPRWIRSLLDAWIRIPNADPEPGRPKRAKKEAKLKKTHPKGDN
jgi:hypothetical protein